MPRAYSTKRPRRIPSDFEPFFIANGWCRCNDVFGKRETLRYAQALGVDRLAQARQAHKARAGTS